MRYFLLLVVMGGALVTGLGCEAHGEIDDDDDATLKVDVDD